VKAKLDIGCGSDKAGEEYLGLDHVETDEVNVVHDLETGELPFDDNRFEEVFSRNCLEHLSEEAYLSILEEIKRVSQPGAEIVIIGPHYLSWYSKAGDHDRSFSKVSMNVFSQNHEYPNTYPTVFEYVDYRYRFSCSTFTKVLRTVLLDSLVAAHLPNTVEEIKFIGGVAS